jgi:hypothetical protein
MLRHEHNAPIGIGQPAYGREGVVAPGYRIIAEKEFMRDFGVAHHYWCAARTSTQHAMLLRLWMCRPLPLPYLGISPCGFTP